MSDVFISYSRKNSTFARRLIDRLSLANKDAWVDWEGIPLTAPNWWSEIKAGIDGADSFVFILSPDSMASVVCNMELDYAIELRKRIVPVVHMEVVTRDAFASIADFQPDEAMEERLAGKDPLMVARDNWQRLSHINWVFFREADDFDAAFETLVKTVETDLEYVKAHTRYLIRAQEWQRENQRADLLLFGSEIDRAEAWLQKGEGYATAKTATDAEKEKVVNPLPDDLHREYIRVSRQADRRRRRLVRSAQLSIAVLILVLIAGLVIGSSIVTQTQQEAADIRATSAQDVALAETQVGDAAHREADAVTAVADAHDLLTAVPPTLTRVNQRVLDALSQANAAETQVDNANDQLATATQALVTATRIAQQAAQSQATLGAVNTQVVFAEATVTQAAIVHGITIDFASTFLQQDTNPSIQLVEMNHLVERYPQQGFAWLHRGSIYDQLGNYEQAIADYDHAIELDPQLFIAYNNRGYVYYELGEYERAIIDYERAIELNPQYAFAYVNRGNAYYELGEYERAITDYERAIELNPQNAIAYSSRGFVYYVLGETEQAMADYERAIELNPQNAFAYAGRGNVYYKLGEYEQAIADYERAIELNPQNAFAYAGRGNVYYKLGEYEQAIADIDRAIELDPQSAIPYYYRGLVYHKLGQTEQAIVDFDRAIELDPHAIPYYHRGVAYHKLGEYEQAITDFDRAIELDPQLGSAYYYRGNAYHKLGEYEQAITDFDRAIELEAQLRSAYYYRGAAYYMRVSNGESETPESDRLQALSDWREAERLGQTLQEDVLNAIAKLEAELGITPTPAS